MSGNAKPMGPDLEQGIGEAELEDGEMIEGHVGEEAVLLARSGDELFAVGATCTHYGGPLARGLLDGATVRCPWHHACFDLRSGEALVAPALRPISCWNVERRDGRVRVTSRKPAAQPRHVVTALRSIVIVGGGAAGHAAAETVRKRGFDGKLTLLSADRDAPYDRPNLSKDYLAGQAPEDWIPLRSPEFFRDNRIDLVLATSARAIDLASRRLIVEDGKAYAFDALLLATGAEPVRLSIPGSEMSHVHYLRSLADSRAVIAELPSTRRAVIVGAGFIGLEVAASLRARGVAVDVVSTAETPLAHALGSELGRFVRTLHEEHGVRFHLRQTAVRIEPKAVILANGESVAADLVVIGIGVRPRVELARSAGLVVDDGVVVDELLRTSASGVFAAGDVARWPDPREGSVRVEHWAVAERHGQIAARNMLGEGVACRFPPFFWSQHYDVQISYVGHALPSDSVQVLGSLHERNAVACFRRAGRVRAIATIGRDRQCLQAELALEREDQTALAALSG